ncbi:MAG: cyclic nucleotide-binding domain-containing protein [Verrucomicrobiales bacterium]
MSDAPELPALGIFSELDQTLRERLAAAGRFEVYKPGTYIAVQGEPHHQLTFVISGHLDVYVRSRADTIKVATIGPGETAGEMNLIDPRAASADVVVSHEPVQAFTISDADFELFVKEDCAAGYIVLRALARELCRRLRLNSEALLRQADRVRTHFRDEDY